MMLGRAAALFPERLLQIVCLQAASSHGSIAFVSEGSSLDPHLVMVSRWCTLRCHLARHLLRRGRGRGKSKLSGLVDKIARFGLDGLDLFIGYCLSALELTSKTGDRIFLFPFSKLG